MMSIRITSKLPSGSFWKMSAASFPFHAFVITAFSFSSRNSAISIFSSLSSTNKILTPAMDCSCSSFSGFRSFSSASILNGIWMVNVVPFSTSLTTSISPCIFSTSFFTMDNPSPVPPRFVRAPFSS